ncbi:exodeoxyribonuclease VII large subunit [Proteiniphilum sp. UBA1028]|mgnify:CR=1 FL=1|jgi:exodeoxyribonuclease VII large subunit|uniref:exodeoxyribonuclease VII large subunit n=1 Tax=Proteiniphilum sp. UBA1028 TaxID=1947251 RepID=UPI000E9C2D27|nr:exodeoxyribonuclease VII large subunit [Proteiniphilum sp. UBA1028]HBG58725.1 exodeoxyribonuclease VII large subunit [Porphyromonadaceae bacterium]
MFENTLSLSELNFRVRDAIRNHLPDSYWIRAETSDVRPNRNGHCYLEFIEKDPARQSIVAKARGVIWSGVFQMLSAYFEKETGQPFASGLNVLVRVSVDFHELYGYSLSVLDIDPSFTLGEIARLRQLVVKQLEEEGVLTLNKELSLQEPANRIAVISSPTAAGYEDFRDQLLNNPGGLAFYTKLFPAIMQGDRSEASVIEALEKIFHYRHLFDAVAIIRGGGASSDLSCFDSYGVAAHVAQFPLPVVSGIGHERDVTVLDIVAHTRAKTPTAVAELFITHVGKTASELAGLRDRIVLESEAIAAKEQTLLYSTSKELVHQSMRMLQKETAGVQQVTTSMHHELKQLLLQQRHFIENKQQFVQMVSPLNVLRRGYTLTLKNGKSISSLQDLKEGDTIVTYFKDGTSASQITGIKLSDDPLEEYHS